METLRRTDIYLLDQIFKGTYGLNQKVLDAGCGIGRNMKWFAENKRDILGCDINVEALQEAQYYTDLPHGNFKVARVENMPYNTGEFDHVICNAVLHFAGSEAHFLAMAKELYRVLKIGGTLFIRMTSNFGLPNNYKALGDGRYYLKDESERFLLTQKLLNQIKQEIGFQQLEPVKSVLVEDLRAMTTLMLIKTA